MHLLVIIITFGNIFGRHIFSWDSFVHTHTQTHTRTRTHKAAFVFDNSALCTANIQWKLVKRKSSNRKHCSFLNIHNYSFGLMTISSKTKIKRGGKKTSKQTNKQQITKLVHVCSTVGVIAFPVHFNVYIIHTCME